ncbi:MAG TPA: 23S rRNA methyltransferase [Actinophytocola sp.]|uniref:putative RNA methyltransferase n=1 Tax=Actinophytocola sp. TaxID=1872138 RepID=UPI002DBFAF8B|nr:23S rRNA methyltransferase [Actinophytocola sp.]HEU5475751.1 23S rRNA methyltransferase [Actinophytocola sp.]
MGSRVVTPVLVDVLPFLACPTCGAELTLDAPGVRCAHAHTFDVARQGYLNLVTGRSSGITGDTAEMIDARARFLAAGHFAPVERAVVAAGQRAMADRPDGCVVDVGAGTGHYLAPVLDALPGRIGVALDVSKPALRRAARAHPRAGAVGCDVWHGLPVRAGSAALALSIFAPRNPAEIHRMLAGNGVLVVVSPTVRHLAELVWKLDLLKVEPEKQERITAAIAPYCQLSSEDDWEFTMSLPHEDVESVVAMGPSAWHTDPGSLRDRVRALDDPIQVTASVIVSTYRRRPEAAR